MLSVCNMGHKYVPETKIIQQLPSVVEINTRRKMITKLAISTNEICFLACFIIVKIFQSLHTKQYNGLFQCVWFCCNLIQNVVSTVFVQLHDSFSMHVSFVAIKLGQKAHGS